MHSLYSVFYEKLPSHRNDLAFDGSNKLVTFLNPYYMELLKNRSELYSEFDYICSDGMIPIVLNKLWNHPKSSRVSFDMTSLAKDLFTHIENTELSIFFIGSGESIIEMFVHTVKKVYPNLNICGYHHGYIKNRFVEAAKMIMDCKPNIVVIGMGAPLQDEFAVYLHTEGFGGTVYTCGGFFHQTAVDIKYYPEWVDRFNLRAIYRLFKEPYVLKRILKYYPLFIFRYSMFLWKLK